MRICTSVRLLIFLPHFNGTPITLTIAGANGMLSVHFAGNDVTRSGLMTDDIRLRQRFSTTIRPSGYAGAAHIVRGGGSGFVGGASCLTL